MLIHKSNGLEILAKVGDITDETTDVIVNAANNSLLGGAGVDGAIHKNGGPEILEACKSVRLTEFPQGLPTGKAVITTSGKLSSKFVIHTVGPVFGSESGNEESLLQSCYRNSLLLADKHKLQSISFPAISTGAFGFPKELAAKTAFRTVLDTSSDLHFVEAVTFVFFSQNDCAIFVANCGN